ncbi:putative ripening-related protein 4 [Triticum aestivum]|nr:putative ripening-related protein 4 [Triticum aestivum]
MANLKKLLAMFALLMFLSHLRVHGVSVSVGSSANVTIESSHSRGRCHISGFLHGKSGDCNRDHGSVCCKDGHRYPQFRCSPPVSADTPAILTLNSFARGGDGGGKSFCDNRFHKDTELVVALSTGWLRLDGKRRCNKMIRINGNGRAVLAKVVDECDSVYGCDAEHNFEPPCPYNDVDASPAVWKALGLKEAIGVFKITWSDVTWINQYILTNAQAQIADLQATCHISGFLHGKSGDCNRDHGSVCCKDGHRYPQFRCSPPVSADTPAILTLNSFARGGDGGGKSFCDNRFHKDTELVVALSTGWLRLDGKRRCNKMIRINGNGRAVLAKVVDECDSVYGCDAEHNFEPPCPYNDVDASPAVWKALGLKEAIGVFKITWSDV